ncbi:LysR family transcriptional regulator [Yersinia sp. 2466 StPb PI]|uniref:LysR family transcriptional regulator n=1 Tax=Yersinia TaxID=629 RepID=UPI00355C4D3E
MILLSKTLRYFIITAQEQSIRLASMILCITPSPLCRTIKMFEISLGHRLFIRTSNGLKLTSYGRELYELLLPVYQEVCELENKILKKNTKNNISSSNFKLGMDHHDYSYLTNLFTSPLFKETKKDISLEYFSPDSVNMDDVLKNGLCQIFFTNKKLPCPPDIVHRELSADAIMLAVQTGVDNNNISVNDLIAGKALVQYELQLNDNVNQEIESHFEKNKSKIKRLSIPELYMQLSMVEKGDSVGFFPSSVNNIITERNYKIKLLPFLFNGKELYIQRHIYFMKSNQEFINKNLLPLIDSSENSILS